MPSQIQPGGTPLTPWIDGEAIDREIAQESLCECGSSMHYRGERGVDEYGDPYYRAFAVCNNEECGNEIEF